MTPVYKLHRGTMNSIWNYLSTCLQELKREKWRSAGFNKKTRQYLFICQTYTVTKMKWSRALNVNPPATSNPPSEQIERFISKWSCLPSKSKIDHRITFTPPELHKKMQTLNFHHLQKSNLLKTFQEGIYLHSPVFGHAETKTAKKMEQKNLEDIHYFIIKSMLIKISCLQQQTTP